MSPEKTLDSAGVRMDKWLWAARFFRTRSLAKAAIEGGKVHCQGQRVKVSRLVSLGMELCIRQGLDEKTVVVTALADVRGPASTAQQLYAETEASMQLRLQQQARRQALAQTPTGRPDKKQRRQIHQFKEKNH